MRKMDACMLSLWAGVIQKNRSKDAYGTKMEEIWGTGVVRRGLGWILEKNSSPRVRVDTGTGPQGGGHCTNLDGVWKVFGQFSQVYDVILGADPVQGRSWTFGCLPTQIIFWDVELSLERDWGFWQTLSEPKPAKCHCDRSISVKLLSSGVAAAYTDACGHSFPGQALAPPLTGLHEVLFGP